MKRFLLFTGCMLITGCFLFLFLQMLPAPDSVRTWFRYPPYGILISMGIGYLLFYKIHKRKTKSK
ncbi:MAG: hypothetical protein LUG51_05600 [Tannerellaceae bacterium]|nr:hypothetical protein [Tannerellaceae bacterium]